MFALVFYALLVVLAAGLVIKLAFDYIEHRCRITWGEFGVGSAIAAIIVIPIVVTVGWHMAIGQKVRYHEFWNGWEQTVQGTVTSCDEDGGCDSTYDCDPYEVTDTSTDAQGNTVTTSHTEYHSCPYVTKEYHYYVNTTLGQYEIGGTRFADEPTAWRSSDGEGIPNVPRGAPQLWKDARDRINAGNNGPVTKQADYDNFILASQSTILKQYSDSVARYKKQHLLPKVPSSTWDYYHADKVHALGVKTTGFTDAVERLDAALGSDLQGDLHVVIVDAAKVPNPDNYALSLQAYWGSPELGKYDLSKNGVVLVLGASGSTQLSTVSWARAFTGMPVGNNALLKQLQTDVVGKPLDPAVLFGHVTVSFNGDKPVTQHTHGIVENDLWGTNKFQRVCMSCKSKGDKGVGFLYLKNELQLSSGDKVWMIILATLLSMGLWVAALVFDINNWKA